MASASQYPRTAEGPAQSVALITPSDTATIFAKALLVSTDMTLHITDAAGNDVTGVPVVKGYNPISVQRVWATGSTTNSGTIYGLS